MNKPYFLLLFILPFQLLAQQDSCVLSGKITTDSLPAENVHIFIKNSNRGTISNADGTFKISVKLGDTILFSNIQFEKKTLVINKNHLEKKYIHVILTQKNITLKEVVIENMAKTLGLPNADKEPLQQTERKLNYINKGGNIDKLYGWISGNKKKLKILEKRKQEDDIAIDHKINVQMIRNHFKDDFFIHTLKIPKQNIDNAIYSCLSEGIVYLFEKERYLEVIDMLIQNKNKIATDTTKLKVQDF